MAVAAFLFLPAPLTIIEFEWCDLVAWKLIWFDYESDVFSVNVPDGMAACWKISLRELFSCTLFFKREEVLLEKRDEPFCDDLFMALMPVPLRTLSLGPFVSNILSSRSSSIVGNPKFYKVFCMLDTPWRARMLTSLTFDVFSRLSLSMPSLLDRSSAFDFMFAAFLRSPSGP